MCPGRRLTKGGKPVAAGESAAAAKAKEKVASPTNGKWMPSTITGIMLDLLVDSDYLPQPTIAIPRFPVIVPENGDVLAEAVPQSEPFKRVSFVPFLLCGLGYPIHPFSMASSTSTVFKCTTSP